MASPLARPPALAGCAPGGIGACLSWVSIAVVTAIVTAVLLAAYVGALLLAGRLAPRWERLPNGPFMLPAALAALVVIA